MKEVCLLDILIHFGMHGMLLLLADTLGRFISSALGFIFWGWGGGVTLSSLKLWSSLIELCALHQADNKEYFLFYVTAEK